jgi:o-succinylbenzoate---CoA ligase
MRIKQRRPSGCTLFEGALAYRPVSGSVHLLAVVLPRPAAAEAIVRAWEAGEAVAPLDPDAPRPELARALAAIHPTHLLDATGRSRLPGGRPCAAGAAAVVATSGTGGLPKAVELDAAAVRAAASAVSSALGTGPGDRWLCCLPLHGVAGLAILARAWHAGLPVEVHERFDPGRVAAAAGRATLVSLVPAMLPRLLAAGVDLGRFRRVLLGGGPIPAGTPAGPDGRLVRTYGLTETFGGVVHDGHPLAGVELRVDGGSGGRKGSPPVNGGSGGRKGSPPVNGGSGGLKGGPPVDGGEILVRGPMLFRGYRGDPARTAAALRGGWLRTGDLGRLDAAGALVVLGRRDELIVTGGVNVHPVEVEAVLAAHPAVAAVAVAGLPDPRWGQRVAAFVVPRDPAAPPTLAELRALALERLAAAKAPRELVLVPALPRGPSGKLLRRLLAAAPATRARTRSGVPAGEAQAE